MARILRRRLLFPVARLHPLLLTLLRQLLHPLTLLRQLLHPLLLFPVARLLALAQAPLQLLHQYNVSTKKMSVSLAQEKNLVTEYYNRVRGEKQANNKSRYLNASLASLRRRKGYKTRVRSPLHPLSEFEAQNPPNRPEANHTDGMYNGLTREERNLLRTVRGYGGRRSRRSRKTRHRASRRR